MVDANIIVLTQTLALLAKQLDALSTTKSDNSQQQTQTIPSSALGFGLRFQSLFISNVSVGLRIAVLLKTSQKPS